MGRGRADPLPPLECRLASPPSPPSFSVASLAHFLSPTDPTEHAHTHAHTHFGGPGGLAPGWAIPAAGARGEATFCYSNHTRRAPSRGLRPRNRSFGFPTPTGEPPTDSGIPQPPGARRARPPAGPRLPRPCCALRLRTRPPPPLRLPSLSPSFLRSSLGPAAAAAAFPSPRGPCRPPSSQHGTIGAGLVGSSIWGEQDLKGWGVPCSLGHGCEQDGK